MNRNIILWLKIAILTIFLILIDQFTKYMAVVRLKAQNDVILIKNVLRLHYLDGGNTGAAWGLLSGKIILFVVFTIIAMIFIIIFIYNTQRIILNTDIKSTVLPLKILNCAFVFLLSGAAGNLIDRIVHGYVIDFIYFELINFPIFNVADCYVTIACAVIVIICFFKVKENEFNQIFSLKRK